MRVRYPVFAADDAIFRSPRWRRAPQYDRDGVTALFYEGRTADDGRTTELFAYVGMTEQVSDIVSARRPITCRQPVCRCCG